MINIGQVGEVIVRDWLCSQGYIIIENRWRCVWGEIDIIAQNQEENTLTFVEVKTRKKGKNLDSNGILAVNINKQKKIILTAETFLAQNPLLAELNCRFDVVLVAYEVDKNNHNQDNRNNGFNSAHEIYSQGYKWTIIDYIDNAFSSL